MDELFKLARGPSQKPRDDGVGRFPSKSKDRNHTSVRFRSESGSSSTYALRLIRFQFVMNNCGRRTMIVQEATKSPASQSQCLVCRKNADNIAEHRKPSSTEITTCHVVFGLLLNKQSRVNKKLFVPRYSVKASVKRIEMTAIFTRMAILSISVTVGITIDSFLERYVLPTICFYDEAIHSGERLQCTTLVIIIDETGQRPAFVDSLCVKN